MLLVNLKTYCEADTAMYEIKLLESWEDITEVKNFWQSVKYLPNTDYDLFNIIADSRSNIIRPHLIVLYKNDQPVTLLIGRIEKRNLSFRIGYLKLFNMPVDMLQLLHGGFIGETSDKAAQKCISAIIDHLKEKKAGLACFTKLKLDSPLFKYAQSIPYFPCRDHNLKPQLHWKINLPDSYQQFLQPKKRLRKRMREFNNKFRDRIRYQTFFNQSDVLEFCQKAESIAKKTYQRGLGVGFIHNTEWEERLYNEATKGGFRGYVMFIDGLPVAFELATLHKNVCHCNCSAYDPAFRKFSIGHILFTMLLKDIIENTTATTVDYGIGDADYKKRFGNESWEESDICIYPMTFKGIRLNLYRYLTTLISKTLTGIAEKIGLKNIVKKKWRLILVKKNKP